jgi:hypothetical protein
MKTNATIESLGGVGVLTTQDLKDFNKAQRLILGLMSDGEWHPASKIIEVGGQRESLRRLRDLRSSGYDVRLKRDSESRDFLYQLRPLSA